VTIETDGMSLEFASIVEEGVGSQRFVCSLSVGFECLYTQNFMVVCFSAAVQRWHLKCAWCSLGPQKFAWLPYVQSCCNLFMYAAML
jgi:hypothetical protein